MNTEFLIRPEKQRCLSPSGSFLSVIMAFRISFVDLSTCPTSFRVSLGVRSDIASWEVPTWETVVEVRGLRSLHT